ncbi:hypothetical protein [Legionella sp. CNM-4043-24]|uniref:hypothetical protein n=1 Tax=Legionella sp. CNM-4043-24 TaxID=3421646 RepID=UPI00403B2BDC
MTIESLSTEDEAEPEKTQGIEGALRELSKKGASDTIDMYQHMRGISALNACLRAIEEELAAQRIDDTKKVKLEAIAFEMTLNGFGKKNTVCCDDEYWNRVVSGLGDAFEPHFRLLGRLAGLLSGTATDTADDRFDPQVWIPF